MYNQYVVAYRVVNNTFWKYCQYQYQYFFHKVLAIPIPIPILSNQYKYTNIINIVLLHLLIIKSSNWVCKCPLKYCRYSYFILLAEYSLVFKTQKFAQRKNSIISKCSLLSLAHWTLNTRTQVICLPKAYHNVFLQVLSWFIMARNPLSVTCGTFHATVQRIRVGSCRSDVLKKSFSAQPLDD